MNNIFKFLWIAISASVLFSACQDIVLEGEKIEFDMTIHAEAEASKAAFTNGEKLLVVQKANDRIRKKESSEGKIGSNRYRMDFSVNFDMGSENIGYEYFAFYPYSAISGKTDGDDLKLDFQLPSVQYPTDASFDSSAEILLADQNTNGQPKTLNLEFDRAVTAVKVTFENLNVGNVRKLRFTLPQRYSVAGKGTIDILTSEIAVSDGVNYIELDYSSNPVPSERLVAYFTCFPFDLPEGSLVTLDIETDKGNVREKVETEIDFIFKAGELYEIPIEFEDEAPAATTFANVKAPGTYSVNNALVMAVGKSGRYVLNDGTANAYVFAPDLSTNVGEVVNLSGEVQLYDRVLEWNKPEVTKTGETRTVTYPSPYDYDEAAFESYKTAPKIGYIKARLAVVSLRTGRCGDYIVYLAGQDMFNIGYYDVWGYAIGYNSDHDDMTLLVVKSEYVADIIAPASNKSDYFGNWTMQATDCFPEDANNPYFSWSVTLEDGGSDENYEYVTINHFLPYNSSFIPVNSYKLIYRNGYLYLAPSLVPYTDKFFSSDGTEYKLNLACLNHELKIYYNTAILVAGKVGDSVWFSSNDNDNLVDGFYVYAPEKAENNGLCGFYDLYMTPQTSSSSASMGHATAPIRKSRAYVPQDRKKISSEFKSPMRPVE
ncbi:MAG: hypothetical protein ACI3ZQ_04555 [Candidatus Cryptobacteroides sp.]